MNYICFINLFLVGLFYICEKEYQQVYIVKLYNENHLDIWYQTNIVD